ncbi:PP2C family protein-serine/threonine phosphatase [Actinacidiphila glaucinigra]|uniref:PP2C family protein-serine/threonine phosphatase n=1 Tax=Actinacidiphila glaucinigra TaxID=235986 RepID=UPI00371A52AC
MVTVDDTGFGALLSGLLQRSHEAAPKDWGAALERAAHEVGLDDVTVLLADVRQVRLVPLPGGPASRAREAVAVDGTPAGAAYRTASLRLSERDDRITMWLPLVDGVERVGVMEVTAHRIDPELLSRCRALADVTTLTIVSGAGSSDDLLRLVRSRPMTTAAELVWAFLPRRTIGTTEVTSSAVLEPAYEIGGDAFDHSLQDDHLHLAVVDAMGHDLASGLTAAVALAGCRGARRAGADLGEIVKTVDETLAEWIPDRFATAVFADLDVRSGQFAWANCGHPPPRLIRGRHVVPGALERDADLPLGLGSGYGGQPRSVHSTRLEPGDRVLVHTDGVTESRAGGGDEFGERRLTEYVVHATAFGDPAAEVLRRLVHAILAHRHGRLDDDATVLLAEWHPTR